MTGKWLFRVGLVMMLGSAFVSASNAEEALYTNTIMHPDRETRRQWIESCKLAPSAQMVDELNLTATLSGSLSLLGYLEYLPAEWDQGSCGNCWAWAGIGVVGVALNVQEGISDRPSVQFISSCNTEMTCCEGGWLRDFAAFYTLQEYAIPWSNANAGWGNGDGNCNVLCETISTLPNYPLNLIMAETIRTHHVGQAQAIANIKNVLAQGRAVWFGFFMGTQADWSRFYAFWNTQAEDALWDFDESCGKSYTSAGGGHAVLCVGYNDEDPDNAYWVMLNSWGTTEKRPNGLFRVDMNMDYDCADDTGEYNLFWQTLDISFSIEEEIVYVEPSALCGGNLPCYSTIGEAIHACGVRATIRVSEGRYPEHIILDTAKAIRLQGGWDPAFTTQFSSTTVNSLTVNAGTVRAEYLVCQ